jgi:hypothetical protein
MDAKVEQPNALDTNLNVIADQQVVEITQRSDRFALHPQRVVIPFQAVVVMAAQILLLMNGVTPSNVSGPGANESRKVQ